MKSVTLAEIQTWHSGIQKYLTLTFENGTVLDNTDIVSESLDFQQGISDSNQLEFGTVTAASFTVKILANATADTLQGQRFTAVIRCGEYSRQIGRFTVETDEKSSDRRFRTLECYDELFHVLNEDFSEWHNNLDLTLVSTVKGYRDAFFRHLNDIGYTVTQETVTLPCDSISIVTYSQGGQPVANFVADGYSGQDVLFYICQLNACFGYINSEGRFSYVRPVTLDQSAEPSIPKGTWQPLLNDEPLTTETPEDIFAESGEEIIVSSGLNEYAYPYVQGSLDFEEYYTERITMVSVRQSENDLGGQYGEAGATYSIVGNPLLFNKSTDQLNNIARTLLPFIANVTYMPMEFKSPACLWMELGDGIAVNSNYGYAQTVLLNRSMKGITALMEEYSADGVKSRSDKANNLQKSVFAINNRTNEMIRTVDQNQLRIEAVETTVNGEMKTQISDLTQTVEKLESKIVENASGFFFNCTPTDNGDGTLTIEAHFYLGQKDVTKDYPPQCYTWHKKTEDGKEYIGYGYTITVVKDEYGYGGEVEATLLLLVDRTAVTTQGWWIFSVNGGNRQLVAQQETLAMSQGYPVASSNATWEDKYAVFGYDDDNMLPSRDETQGG